VATSDNERCDQCRNKVAIYVEKKRRRGRLTREQYCAGCLQWAYGRYGQGPEDFRRIHN